LRRESVGLPLSQIWIGGERAASLWKGGTIVASACHLARSGKGGRGLLHPATFSCIRTWGIFLFFVSDLGNGNQFPFPILEKHCVSDLGNGNHFPFPILERSWQRKPVSVSYYPDVMTMSVTQLKSELNLQQVCIVGNSKKLALQAQLLKSYQDALPDKVAKHFLTYHDCHYRVSHQSKLKNCVSFSCTRYQVTTAAGVVKLPWTNYKSCKKFIDNDPTLDLKKHGFRFLFFFFFFLESH
jgi:hypothetical protein